METPSAKRIADSVISGPVSPYGMTANRLSVRASRATSPAMLPGRPLIMIGMDLISTSRRINEKSPAQARGLG